MILDLEKSYKIIEFLFTLQSVFPNVSILYNHSTVIKTKK